MEEEAIATNCTPVLTAETKITGNEEIEQLNFEEKDIENIVQKEQLEFLFKSLEFLKFKLSINYDQSIFTKKSTDEILVTDANTYLKDYIDQNNLQVFLEYLFYKSKQISNASLLNVQPILKIYLLYWMMNTQNYLLLELYIQKFATLYEETQSKKDKDIISAEEFDCAQGKLTRYLKNIHILQNTILFTVNTILESVLKKPAYKQITIVCLILKQLLSVHEQEPTETCTSIHTMTLLNPNNPDKLRIESIKSEDYKQTLSQVELKGFTDMQNTAVMGQKRQQKDVKPMQLTLTKDPYISENATLDLQRFITKRGESKRMKLYESLAKTLKTPTKTWSKGLSKSQGFTDKSAEDNNIVYIRFVEKKNKKKQKKEQKKKAIEQNSINPQQLLHISAE